MGKKLFISIGVTAHNEALNIQNLIESLLAQKMKRVAIREIVVISSGSTDKTNQIVKKIAAKHPLIKLITQKKRLGKASAVNLLLDSVKENIIVLCSADLFIPIDTIEKLVVPLTSEHVGIVGSHPIPLNDKNTFFGYTAHLLWDLHHSVSLKNPKMGECIAFRKAFKKIPIVSAVDEANIESIIKSQGYEAKYAPDAIIYNKGPETLKDFIIARRRIYAGHLSTKHEYSYEVSTMHSFKILIALITKASLSWRFIFWTPMVIALESYSRLLGYVDYTIKGHKYTIWTMTSSTKKLPTVQKI